MLSLQYMVMIFIAGLVTGAACGPSITRAFRDAQRRYYINRAMRARRGKRYASSARRV